MDITIIKQLRKVLILIKSYGFEKNGLYQYKYNKYTIRIDRVYGIFKFYSVSIEDCGYPKFLNGNIYSMSINHVHFLTYLDDNLKIFLNDQLKHERRKILMNKIIKQWQI